MAVNIGGHEFTVVAVLRALVDTGTGSTISTTFNSDGTTTHTVTSASDSARTLTITLPDEQ